jgi:hypothetical protein
MRRPLLNFLPLTLFFLVSNVAHAQTPTLLRSWGTVGISSNQADTGNSFKLSLEAQGTPRALAAGDLVLVSVTYPTSVTSVSISDGINTYTSATNCSSNSLKHEVYYSLATGFASQITVTFNAAKSDVQIDWFIFYNVATSNPLDGTICTAGILPANNTAPNIQPGSFTTTVSGDLIFNQVFDEGSGVLGANTISAITYDTGFTGLYAESYLGGAAQYEVQSTAGAINPGMTFSQTSHDHFVSMAIAIKRGTGGSPPGSGISIIRSQMFFNQGKASTALPISFPTSGNLIYVVNEAGTNGVSLTNVTDNISNTYNGITTPTFYPQPFYLANTTPSNNLVVTLHFGSGVGDDLVGMFDITGAATSPLDTAATAANSSVLTVAGSGTARRDADQGGAGITLTDAPSIKPSQAGDLIIAAENIGLGPASGSNYTYDLVAATWQNGGGDANSFLNGDGIAHYYSPNTSIVNFSYAMTNPSSSYYQATATAFKAAAPASKPAPPTNLTVTSVN